MEKDEIIMYSFESTIRYSETDKNNRMKIHSMVNYLQDCSTFQSESVGKGIQTLKEMNRVWVVNAWQINIEDSRGLKFGDDIVIGTWMYNYRGTLAERNFIIEDRNSHRLVNANSIWVLMDTVTMRPVRITEEDAGGYEQQEKIDMEYEGRKIKIEGELLPMEPFPVRRYHIDSNNHVNNANYFLMAEDFIPEEFVPVRLRAEYRKSAMLGDVIYPYIMCKDNVYIVSLCDEEKNPYAVIEFKK